MNCDLKNLGLTEQFIQESKQYKDLFIGRVSSQTKNVYKVITENGEIFSEISGKFHFNVKGLSEFPAVGDFVMIDRIAFSRKWDYSSCLNTEKCFCMKSSRFKGKCTSCRYKY